MKHSAHHKHTVYPQDIQCVFDKQNGKGAIYVGNLEASENLRTLQKHKIKGVLTASKSIFLDHPKSQIPHYLYVPAEDHQRFDISVYFDKAADFIDKVLKETNILVHCMAGVSRSVSLVIAYLMKYHNMSFKGALESVRRKRRIINPNRGFIKQLQQYEIQLSKSIKAQRRSVDNNYGSTDTKTLSPKTFKRSSLYESQRQSYMGSSFYKKPEGSWFRQNSINHEQKKATAEKIPNQDRSLLLKQNQQKKYYESRQKHAHSIPNKSQHYTSFNDLNKQLDRKIENIRKKYMEATDLLEKNERRSIPSKQNRQNRYQSSYFTGLKDMDKSYLDYNYRRGFHGYDRAAPNEIMQPTINKNWSTIEPYSRKMSNKMTSSYLRPSYNRNISFNFDY